MCLRPIGEQCPPAVIFPGTGARISKAEKAQWDPDVHVMFQKKAWADTAICKQWLLEVFLPHRRKVAQKGSFVPAHPSR